MRGRLMEMGADVWKADVDIFSSLFSAWLNSHIQEAPEVSLQYVTMVIKWQKKL